MAHIATNFDSVPDKVLPVDPGMYTCTVEECNLEDVKPPKVGQKLVVILKIADSESPNFGRTVYDHISTKMTTNIKRLWKSAGLKPSASGIDTEEILGKTVKCRIKNRAYKNESGEMQESSAVQEYMFDEA